MKINDKNIELILFRYKEGLLSPEESSEVEHFLEQHPAWRELADMYDPSLCITADTTTVYPNKDKLRDIMTQKPQNGSALHLWSWISAAACVVLGLSVGLHFLLQTEVVTPSTSKDKIAKINPEPLPISTDTIENEQERLFASSILPQDKMQAKQETTINNTAETTSTKPVCTDQLITYIDEDDTTYNSKFLPFDLAMAVDEPATGDPLLTDQLITYVNVDTDSVAEALQARNYAFEDWVNNLRLSRLEFQTNLFNQFCKLIEK